MKRNRKILLGILIIALLIASFFAGRYMTELRNSRVRAERCRTLIVFAIDKVENGDLTDQGTMRALISNVYAAYQFCDDTISADQLHDLWNYLIFEGDSNIDATKEIILQELNGVLQSIKLSQ